MAEVLAVKGGRLDTAEHEARVGQDGTRGAPVARQLRRRHDDRHAARRLELLLDVAHD